MFDPDEHKGPEMFTTLFIIAGVVAVILGFAFGCRGSVVTERFLDAVERVESNGDASAVGDNGKARGGFQFWAVAWKRVNGIRLKRGMDTVPYQRGSMDRATARQFARLYFLDLESRLAATNRNPPTTDQLYAAWNLGLAGLHRRGFLLSRCPVSTRHAAARIRMLSGNINGDLRRRQRSDARRSGQRKAGERV